MNPAQFADVIAKVIGPHHRDPNGEIDLVMPLGALARFDGAIEFTK